MRQAKLSDRADPLFRTKKFTVLEIWDQIQRLQTKFSFAQELSCYYTTPQWHAAKTVLDLGTRNKYYLRKIAGCFPDKVYHDMDISAELIAIAQRESKNKNVSFSH